MKRTIEESIIKPEKRLKVYLELKNRLSNPENFRWETMYSDITEHYEKVYNFCAHIDRVAKTTQYSIEDFPELYAQKPKTGWKEEYAFWWSPFSPKSRLKAVERAISLCESVINKPCNRNCC